MKSLKQIFFMFNLLYEVKEVTRIKVTYRGRIILKFASRKKDQEFFVTASGEQIQPELFSTNSILSREQHNELQDILNYENFINAFKSKLGNDGFPSTIKGDIIINENKINWKFGE